LVLICKVKGGFANQCIQYMFAISVGLISGRKVYFDCSDYIFGGFFQKLKRNTVQKLSINLFSADLELLKVQHPFYYIYHTVFNKTFNDDSKLSSIFSCNDDVIYLDGYWHKHVFIDCIDETLRLKVKHSIEKSSSDFVKSFNSRNANKITTAIHVRRGDYLASKYINVYGVCPISYYLNAANALNSKLCDKKNVFIYFSDTPEWVVLNLRQIKNASFSKENLSFLDDFILMMNCDNYIISNSSFSWLASFLGAKTTSIIYAPSMWFKDETLVSLPLTNLHLIETNLD